MFLDYIPIGVPYRNLTSLFCNFQVPISRNRNSKDLRSTDYTETETETETEAETEART